MEEFLKISYTINDETRVKLLIFIGINKEVCVCDVENSFKMIQSRVSRHLKILKEGGFLNIERRGKWAFYSLKKDLDTFRERILEKINSLEIEIPDIIHTCEIY